ncbi:MAG: hypothetical protein AAFQ36_09475 [Pseudomonadota bacterium]
MNALLAGGAGLAGAGLNYIGTNRATDAQRDGTRRAQRQIGQYTDAAGNIIDDGTSAMLNFAGDTRANVNSLADAYVDRGQGIANKTYGRQRNTLSNFMWDSDQLASELDPYRDGGADAYAAMLYEAGLGPMPQGYAAPELSAGAEYQMDMGREAIEGSAANRGNLNSGATMASLARMGQGIAAQDRQNALAQLINVGRGADGQALGIMDGANRNALAVRSGANTALGNSLMAAADTGFRTQVGAETGYGATAGNVAAGAMDRRLGVENNALAAFMPVNNQMTEADMYGRTAGVNALAGGLNQGLNTYGFLRSLPA